MEQESIMLTAPISLNSPTIKRKFSFDELIEYLELKDIKFNKISKENAKQILMHSNYYYKITAYRKNFKQKLNRKYIDLDFLLLSDLATIDMRLRYLVLEMCLDIEHSLKTKLVTEITEDDNEDGFSIVEEFCKEQNKTISYYMKSISEESHYNYGLYDKYRESPPVWVFFEIITFGTFVRFVEFYYNTRNNTDYKGLQKVLKYVKNIRNNAAHNSPILMNIVQINEVQNPTSYITNFIIKNPNITKDQRRKKLSNRKIHDLTALLYVFDTYVISKPIKEIRYNDLYKLLIRCKRHKLEYSKHNSLESVHTFFIKTLDFLKVNNV